MRSINHKSLKIASCVMAAVVACGGISAVAYGAGQDAAIREHIPMISARLEDGENDRGNAGEETVEWKDSLDETVYVIAGADGSAEKVIASDWLQNDGAGSSYGRQEAEEQLPVAMKVTYTLDGKEVSAQDVAGATGNLTIRFDYTNQTGESVVIGGHHELIRTPFAVLTGMVFDSAKLSQVSITNGKLISDGDRIIAAGLALPGLAENLKLSEYDLTDQEGRAIELPEYVEIRAYVTDFEMESTYTVVTNEIFRGDGSLDLDALEDLRADLQGDMDDLKDAMTQLIDGSGELYDGIDTLYGKSGELVDGVRELYDGTSDLKDGADTLRSGASDLRSGARTLADGAGQLASGTGELQSGADQLAAGLSQLAANNDTLNAGAKQVFVTLLNTANAQLQSNSALQSAAEMAGKEIPMLTMDQYGQALDEILAMLDADAVYQEAEAAARQIVEARVRENTETVRAAVTQAVREQVTVAVTEQVRENAAAQARAVAEETARDKVLAQVTAGVRANVEAAVLEQVSAQTGTEMTVEEYRGLLETHPEAVAQITAMIDAQMESEEVAGQINALTEQMMQSEEVQAEIEAALASDEVRAQIEAATGAYMEGEGQALIQAQMESESIRQTVEENTEAQIQLLISQNMGSEEVLAQISGAVEAAKAGAGEIAALKTSLDSYQAFYQGLLTYTAGVADASAGAGTLRAGAAQVKSGASSLKDGAGALSDGAEKLADGTVSLSDGASKLKDGVGTLYDGSGALIDGVGELRDGMGELHDGIIRLNEEGIRKLTDLLEEDAEEVFDRLQATIDASDGYRYSDREAEENAVRFIIKTAAVR